MADVNGGTVVFPHVSGLPWHGVHYLSTTRDGGTSAGAFASFNLALHTRDDPARVHENRRRLVQGMPAAPIWLDQVHGSAVQIGRAHVCTPVTNAHLVCRLLLEKKKTIKNT